MVDRSDDASCLLGLEGLAVERVVRTGPPGVKIVQLVTDDPDAARCPACRAVSTSGKDWVLTRPRDLPCGGEFAHVQWRKRRWRCRTLDCPKQTFTEQVAQVPAGMRTTTRLRAALAVAVEDGRDQSEVAAAHQVSWPTVQRAVVAHGAVELIEPEPTLVLGMDETRFGRPRWLPDGHHDDGRIRWVRTDPWETGFVDVTGDQGLLGQVDGRTSAAVQAWLAARSPAFRASVEVVVIDPHAGYAAAVGAALPEARIAVDHFHLIMLANKAVTAVRQRVTRDLLGRRGRKIDPAWANRRLLLRGRERLSPAALARMWNGCIDHDPSGQILTASDRQGGAPRVVRHRRPRRAPRRDPAPALHVLPLVRRRQHRRADHAGRDDRDLVAGDRGIPHDRAHQRPDRGHQQAHQAGETRGLRVQEPGQLPAPRTVALHPANPPIVNEEPDRARLRRARKHSAPVVTCG